MAEVEREGVTTMEFEHDPAMEAVYVKREREWEGVRRERETPADLQCSPWYMLWWKEHTCYVGGI